MQSKNQLSDEELLLASRMGDYKAEAILAERFYEDHVPSCRFVAREASAFLDDWALNEAFFRAFVASITGYRFQNVRFRTYFLGNLKHEVVRLATKKIKERVLTGYEISLDTPIEVYEDGAPGYLSDFVSTGDFMDDPRAFLDYAERLESLHRLPEGEDPRMLDVVRLITANYTLADTARICCMNINHVKYLLNRYRKWAARSRNLIARHRKGPRKKEASDPVILEDEHV